MAGSGVVPTSSGSVNPWVVGGLAGASALPLIFGGGNDESKGPLAGLQKQADQATDLSKQFSQQGMDMFGPASEFLKALISGDRQALLQATQPERRRVIDQYATAKKNLAEFTPRGGGQAAAMNQLEAGKAADLAGVTSGSARVGIVGVRVGVPELGSHSQRPATATSAEKSELGSGR